MGWGRGAGLFLALCWSLAILIFEEKQLAENSQLPTQINNTKKKKRALTLTRHRQPHVSTTVTKSPSPQDAARFFSKARS